MNHKGLLLELLLRNDFERLGLGKRAAGADGDGVAFFGLVLRVVGGVTLGAFDVLLVLRVLDETADGDDRGLIHLVGHHFTTEGLKKRRLVVCGLFHKISCWRRGARLLE